MAKTTGISAETSSRSSRCNKAKKLRKFLHNGITQHTRNKYVRTLANMALCVACRSVPAQGHPLRGQNNVQGACDMGALPETFQILKLERLKLQNGKNYGL